MPADLDATRHATWCHSSWQSAAADTEAWRLPFNRSIATGSGVVYRQTALHGPWMEMEVQQSGWGEHGTQYKLAQFCERTGRR